MGIRVAGTIASARAQAPQTEDPPDAVFDAALKADASARNGAQRSTPAYFDSAKSPDGTWMVSIGSYVDKSMNLLSVEDDRDLPSPVLVKDLVSYRVALDGSGAPVVTGSEGKPGVFVKGQDGSLRSSPLATVNPTPANNQIQEVDVSLRENASGTPLGLGIGVNVDNAFVRRQVDTFEQPTRVFARVPTLGGGTRDVDLPHPRGETLQWTESDGTAHAADEYGQQLPLSGLDVNAIKSDGIAIGVEAEVAGKPQTLWLQDWDQNFKPNVTKLPEE